MRQLGNKLGSWKTGRLMTMALGLALATAVDGSASTLEYYVGIDGLPTITTGSYAGLPNPNHNRLTFLFNHGDHYHGIGTYSYTGPASSPTVGDTNTNNRIPEISSAQPPLPLFPGEGSNAGRWISQPVDGLEYSETNAWGPTDLLQGFDPGSEEHTLFNSSGGRWTGSLAGRSLALEAVGLTPGLQVMDHTGTTILDSPGDIHPLGEGSTFLFQPTFFTTENALSLYTGSFRLVDLNNATRNSGVFHLDFTPVPVPAAAWLMLSGLGAMAGLARRKQRASVG